uniref:Pteropsin protein n=1 Tax=Orthetrum albistylum TaxID=254766 RepID=A0A0C6G6N8_9ODON|nr:opsin, pteropsin type [Orthetrum albistylum]
MKSPWETEADGAGGGSEIGVGDGAGPGAEEEEKLLMSPGGYAAAAVCLLLIGLVGFVSNLLVMVLMCKNKQLWTPLNVILFNLVCSDFSVSVLGNPITLTAALFRRWIFGRTMCVIYGFFMSLLGIASITTMMVLSFERYVMISKPFQVRRLSQKGAVALIGVIWVYALLLTAPPLFGWGDYVHESANISCSVNWESKTISATTYIIFLFAMGLVVPVFVICFSYLNIIWTMKKNAVAMGRVTKAECRVTVMVFVMIVAFLVAWTPYSVLALLVAFGDASLISPGVAVVPALMAKSSICYNPVIYVGLNTQFRSAWHKLLGVRAISETSQELGGEHTAVLSPSHYMSHTLPDGGATGTTSGILLGPSSSNSSPIVAVSLKRKVAAALNSTGNGEAAKPAVKSNPSWTKIAVAETLPEEAEEAGDEDGYGDSPEEENITLDLETNGKQEPNHCESKEKEENATGGGELQSVVSVAGGSEPQLGRGKKKNPESVGSDRGGKGRRFRGRMRKSESLGNKSRKGAEKGNGVLTESGRYKGKQYVERVARNRAPEITVSVDAEDDEQVEMTLLSKPEGRKKDKTEAVAV